jgi:hypothetical protein
MMPGLAIPQDKPELNQLLTLSKSIVETVPTNDMDQDQLKSFPVYGSILHLLLQWISRYEHLSPSIQKEVGTFMPQGLLLEARQQTLSQDKELVASFVTNSLPKLIPTLQSLLHQVPIVDQVEE